MGRARELALPQLEPPCIDEDAEAGLTPPRVGRAQPVPASYLLRGSPLAASTVLSLATEICSNVTTGSLKKGDIDTSSPCLSTLLILNLVVAYARPHSRGDPRAIQLFLS